MEVLYLLDGAVHARSLHHRGHACGDVALRPDGALFRPPITIRIPESSVIIIAVFRSTASWICNTKWSYRQGLKSCFLVQMGLDMGCGMRDAGCRVRKQQGTSLRIYPGNKNIRLCSAHEGDDSTCPVYAALQAMTDFISNQG